MKLEVDLPERLIARARELVARENVSLDAFVANALTAQLEHTPLRPTMAERAARVDWQKVDAILARVPSIPPAAGDERL